MTEGAGKEPPQRASLPSRKAIVIMEHHEEAGAHEQPAHSSAPSAKEYGQRRNSSVRSASTDYLHSFYFNRSHLNEKKLLEKYSFKDYKSDDLIPNIKNYVKKYYKPRPSCMKSFFFKRFPIFQWLPAYDYKSNLFKDIIAGLTIGIIQIPQGMAYSLMADMPPILGLYISFFTVMVYTILGTSRHISLGIYAIVSLMVKDSVNSFSGHLFPSEQELAGLANSTAATTTAAAHNAHYLSHDPVEAKIMIGTALAFYVGLIQIIFAVLHVGILTKYLSDTIVAAFTTGAAYHIIISQLNTLLGIKLNPIESSFTLISELIEIFSHITHTNITTLIISIISMVFIYTVKHFVNERYQAKMIAPVPVDLIVIVTGTLLSHFLHFNQRWNVKIVGPIPLGIPKPRVPPLGIFGLIFGDSIRIAIVSFAINISMAKLFANKYKYGIRSNQELFAYGSGNLLSCFFRGFPSCVGLSRTIILDSVGGRTQVYGIISSVVVLVVILALGDLFRSLPIACLSAIIVVALLKLAIDVKQVVSIYQQSKFEALAWSITFLGIIILDVDYGLYIGVTFSLLLIVVRSQRALTSVLGNIPSTEIYENIALCEEAKEFPKVKIIRYESSIYYANVENFIYKVVKLSNTKPYECIELVEKTRKEYAKLIEKLRSKQKKLNKIAKTLPIHKSQERNLNQSELDLSDLNDEIHEEQMRLQTELEERIKEIFNAIPVQDIILDFSCISFIDSMGINALLKLNDLFEEIGVFLHLSYCKRDIIEIFNRVQFHERFDYAQIYPTTHDAVLGILRRNKVKIKFSGNRRSIVNMDMLSSQSSFVRTSDASVQPVASDGSLAQAWTTFYLEHPTPTVSGAGAPAQPQSGFNLTTSF